MNHLKKRLNFNVSRNKRILNLSWDSKLPMQQIELSPIALLDSCKCPHCFHAETNQRKANIFMNNSEQSNWAEWTIENVELVHQKHLPQVSSKSTEEELPESTVRIACTVNGHKVLYDIEHSPLHTTDALSKPSPPLPKPIFWDKSTLQNHLLRSKNTSPLPSVSATADLSSIETQTQWMANLIKYGFCMITDVDTHDDQHTFDLVNHLGLHYKNTLFGSTWSFENKMDFQDTAYTNDTIEPHTDNTYFNDPTRIFFLHCVQYNATGGHSTITDAFHIANQLKTHYPHHFDVLCNTPVLYHYKDNDHHYVHEAPIINLSPDSASVAQIRFNHHDRFHIHHLSAHEQNQFFEAYNVLCKYVHDKANCAEFLLQPGSVLTFDNWRVLHGRTHFEGERRCVGFYTSSDDFESKTRLLFAPKGDSACMGQLSGPSEEV